MKNQKQTVKNKKPAKHAKPGNVELEKKPLRGTDPITLFKEKHFRETEHSDFLIRFYEELKKVFATDAIINTDQINEKHVVKALFNLQNKYGSTIVIDFFVNACKHVFDIFKELNRLTENDKLHWIIEASLSPTKYESETVYEYEDGWPISF